MKLLRVNWNHGRATAEQFIKDRKLLRFMFAHTGEVVDGYIVSIVGATHAMIEIHRRRPSKLKSRVKKGMRPMPWRERDRKLAREADERAGITGDEFK